MRQIIVAKKGLKMTIMNLPTRATLASLSLVLLMGTTVSAGVVALSPHRAVYDLTLKSASDRSGVKDLTGRMVIEMSGSACDGWSVNFRLVNDFQLPRGRSRLVDSRSTSWEAGDGSSMSYLEREFIDNRPHQVTRLRVSMKDGKVRQKQPKETVFDLPANAIFPVTHQKRLIEKAQKGELRDKSIVYDGADRDNIYQAITFIGKKRSGEKQAAGLKGKGAASLLNGTVFWPVTVSYYSLKDKDKQDTPNQQISFAMYENGIAGDLTIDYGDFAMSGKLIRLEKLPLGVCEK